MTTPSAGLPPANWYPDPQTPGQLRYWDGQKWTQHVHPTQEQGAQPAAAPEAAAETASVPGVFSPGAQPSKPVARTPGPASGALATFQPGGRPAPNQTPHSPGPREEDYEAPGEDPRSLRHWLVPAGRSPQSIAAGAIAVLALLATAASIFGFDPAYDIYITYTAAGLGFLAVLFGFAGLSRANVGGYHGKGRSWFAVGAGFLVLLLNAYEYLYPDELLQIIKDATGW